jgi:2-oxoglutarate ferredoxin oxidoreductase subunit beta
MGCGFVARGFSGEIAHLANLIVEAIRYPGLALIDILTPCISFNKTATFASYKSRAKILPLGYDPADKNAAMIESAKWDNEIPIGILYRRDPAQNPPLEEKIAKSRGQERPQTVAGHGPDRAALAKIMNRFIC